MSNALNLQEINQDQALNLAKFFIGAGHNLFLFGQKGVGKTSLAMQAIKELGYKTNYINLSVIERPDLAGYPDMSQPGDIINFKSPYFLPKLLPNEKPNAVILFDEIDKAQPEITAPLLEILLFKKINGIPINVVSCILTGNLASEGAFSNRISSALLDRGAKYVLSFDFEQWMEWGKANGVHDLILGFLRANPEFACGRLEHDDTYASPTPRGWTWASEALLKTKDLKMNDIDSVSQIISGYVGLEAGLRFRVWYEHYRRFEPFVLSLIERGNMSLDWESLHPTEQMVFVISVCYFAKQKVLGIPKASKPKARFLYLERLCKFFDDYGVENELQVTGLTNSFPFDLITTQGLYACKPFFDHFAKITEGVSIRK